MHTTAFVLALLGGLIITVGSIIEILLLSFGPYAGTFYGMGPGMMSGYGFYGYGAGWMTALSAVFGLWIRSVGWGYNAKYPPESERYVGHNSCCFFHR
jgi:hypothetical protein